MQLERAGIALCPSPTDGQQSAKHLCGAHAPWLRPIFHGYRFSVHARKRDLQDESKAVCIRKSGDAVGMDEKRSRSETALRGSAYFFGGTSGVYFCLESNVPSKSFTRRS